MTEADRWTEVVAALIAESPEPPPFEDLDARTALVHERPRRRGPLVAAAVSVFVLVLLATVVLVRVELDDSRSAPAAPPAAADSESAESDGVQPPTFDERLAQCDTAPIDEVNRLGTGQPTISVFDQVTHEFVEIDARAFCRAAVVLSPDPFSNMGAEIVVANGHIAANYYWRGDTTAGPDGAQSGDPVPPEVAAAKIAEERAQQTDR